MFHDSVAFGTLCESFPAVTRLTVYRWPQVILGHHIFFSVDFTNIIFRDLAHFFEKWSDISMVPGKMVRSILLQVTRGRQIAQDPILHYGVRDPL